MRLRGVPLAAWIALCCTVPLQADPPEIIHCRQNAFRIPFQIEAGEQARLKEVQLYIAEGESRTWRLHKTVGPTERHFPFKAERDGMYGFLVRTLDNEGKAFPPAIEGASAGLRVLVDTQLPSANLRALPSRQDQVGVEWEVRDAHLDVATLQIEYRGQAAGEWQFVNVEPVATGQKYFTPHARGAVEVRLRVKDKADNQGSAYVFLNSNEGGQSGQLAPRADKSTRTSTSPGAERSLKVINTTDISLNYSLEDVGPSGVSAVELWYFAEGRAWQRHGEDPDKQSPVQMKVNGEGVYGFTLCVKSGVGLGDRPPAAGDAPQMWIEVDMTKPVVQLQSAEAGRGGEHGSVSIAWTASDKNLAATPISLYYAEQAEGPWKPIAADLDNGGRYVWRVPKDTPFKFFVRVEALDRGGNIGRAESAKPVLVDLHQPKGRLLGAEGASR